MSAPCFCSGGPDLCPRCAAIPPLAAAHAEGLERRAGRDPLPVGAGDAAEIERRAAGRPVERGGVGS